MGKAVSWQVVTPLTVTRWQAVLMITILWVMGDTEARPQNLKGKLAFLTLQVGNSYKVNQQLKRRRDILSRCWKNPGCQG